MFFGIRGILAIAVIATSYSLSFCDDCTEKCKEAWVRYYTDVKAYQANVAHVSITVQGGQRQSNKSDIRLLFNDFHYRADAILPKDVKNKEIESSFGRNTQYAYNCSRRENGWIISEVAMRGTDAFPKLESMVKKSIGYVGIHPVIFGSDDRSILDNYSAGAERELLSRQEYDMNVYGRKIHVKKSRILLSNNTYQLPLIIEAEVIMNITPGALRWTGIYQQVAGVPVLLESKSEEIYPAMKGGVEIQIISENKYDVRLEAPADAKFRLSDYGLPEPANVIWEKPTPTYLWLIAVGVISALTAFCFRRLANRNRVKASAS